MKTVAPIMIEPKKQRYPDSLFTAKHKGEENWFAVWYDHAGRLIKFRLCAAEGVDRAQAKTLARDAVDRYIYMTSCKLVVRDEQDEETLNELAQNASFPREVIARHVRLICDRLARYEASAPSRNGSQPGLQFFADRVDISARELYRIMDDPERISVGLSTVDRICCEFDLLLTDFIDESMEWAEQRGRWEEREGSRDPWPIGYFTAAKPEEDLI